MKVEIKILSDQRYKLEIDGNRNFGKELAFGERFSEMGFDFTINLRNKEGFRYNHNTSNKYYFYFISPDTLASNYRSKLSVTPVVEDASLVTLTTSGQLRSRKLIT